MASDKLTLNLAISDFFALTTYLPWRTHLLLLREKTEQYAAFTSLFVVCIFSTGNAVLFIGFDRFVAVVWPLRYKALITSKLTMIFIAISWASASALGMLHGLCLLLEAHREYTLFLCAFSVFQLVVLSVIYGIILNIARNKNNRSK